MNEILCKSVRCVCFLSSFFDRAKSIAKVFHWYRISCAHAIVNHTSVAKDNRACLLGVSHRLISSQAKVKQDQGVPTNNGTNYKIPPFGHCN